MFILVANAFWVAGNARFVSYFPNLFYEKQEVGGRMNAKPFTQRIYIH